MARTVPGAQGLTGPQGPAGPQGLKGPQGPTLAVHDLGSARVLGPLVQFTPEVASWLSNSLVWEYDRGTRSFRHRGTVDRASDGSNSLAPSQLWGLAFSFSDDPDTVVSCNVVHYTCSGCDAAAWCITGPAGVQWPDFAHQLRVIVE